MSGVLRDLHVLTPSFPTRRSSDLLVIDHLCRNRACCNPAHMEAVTRAENLRRGVVAKLTPAQVNEIRALKGSGLTHREIGLRFDVSQAHTTNILNGKYWSAGPCPAWGVVKSRKIGRASCRERECTYV